VNADFDRRATQLIVEGRLDEARILLEAAIHDMPAGWTPVREDATSLTISFWDRDEFFAYISEHKSGFSKSIFWETSRIRRLGINSL
jgi:hypothetical protein